MDLIILFKLLDKAYFMRIIWTFFKFSLKEDLKINDQHFRFYGLKAQKFFVNHDDTFQLYQFDSMKFINLVLK